MITKSGYLQRQKQPGVTMYWGTSCTENYCSPHSWIILSSFLSLKLLACWPCHLLSCPKVQTCGKKMSWVWDSSLEPPLMHDHYAVWRHLCTTFFQKSFYPITYLSHKPQPRRHILTSACKHTHNNNANTLMLSSYNVYCVHHLRLAC